MRRTLAAMVLVSVAAAPLIAQAQALPAAVREAGVTLVQWQGVQAAVRRSAVDKHVSERALAGVCAKMGVQLARGRHFDLNQMIALINGRADEINAIYQKLALEEQQNSPAATGLLKRARTAIDDGDLDQAEAYLKQASAAARAAVETAQTQEAEITAMDAQVKALQFDYVGAAASYAEAAGELPPNDARERWGYVFKQAQMLEKRGEVFDEPQPLRDSVALLRDAALRLAPHDTDPADWATTENELGGTLLVLGERGDDQALRDGVSALRAALEVWTRDRDPSDWAKAQNNIGAALLVLGERGDDQALRDAAEAFRTTLEVDTREGDPPRWARANNNLGMALLVLGQHGNEQALHDAVAAFRSALEVGTRERDPIEWARFQNNLGVALRELGERGDDQALQGAVAAFHGALEVETRDKNPRGWARDQNNLGIALRALGQRRNDQALLHEAVADIRGALEVNTRDNDATDWARDQDSLGDALEALGERGDDQALHDAVAAYRAALEIWAPAKYPAYAAKASSGLARAQAALAARIK